LLALVSYRGLRLQHPERRVLAQYCWRRDRRDGAGYWAMPVPAGTAVAFVVLQLKHRRFRRFNFNLDF
jgi:hypothetical protein